MVLSFSTSCQRSERFVRLEKRTKRAQVKYSLVQEILSGDTDFFTQAAH